MNKLLYSFMFAAALTSAQVTSYPWTETFEDSSPTSSQWTCQYIAGTNTSVPSGLFWAIQTTTSVGYYGTTGAYQGSKMAVFDTRSHTRDAIARFIGPVMNLSSVANPTLDFYYRNMLWGTDQNILNIYYRTSSSGSWTLITSFNSNISSWTNSGPIVLPNPSATYQIALEGVAKYGYSLDVDNLKVSAGNLAVSEVNKKPLELKISPNPASDILNISSKEEITDIRIHDISGKLMKIENKSSKNQISIQHLKSGTYFITVQYSDGTNNTSKFIKK
ncbi:T9SS type A sorting domain-containing protein [Chryseobacterium geocarposphaerae]|uniref:Putative secreted protein (Por secretion system target) n=1 Tax=Chryseobacterium geocarposphaerae TaxID=1416776 RepID=A0A2M9C2M0_9FLAO|nr:T9SS type A sorting domain-containing protein [Chryseobacterium geocarposphaerae]PJJ64681.1 putative secreted protein (Por secretion system target) [Chryseobacterium geocarposphaerae]